MMNAAVLSADALARWKANPNSGLSSPLSEEQDAWLRALTDAMAGAFVAHMTTSAVVVGSSATGGAVTGTIT
jgi:hypothetical protein